MPTAKKPAKRGKPKTSAKAQQRTAIARRRARVAQLSLAYVPQQAIAIELGVSAATISNDLKAVRADWLADAKTDVQTALVREIESLDRLEARLWQQFSQGAETITPDERSRTAAQILKCKERRAKLLGFDQPDLLEVTISDERLQAEVIELREVLGYDGPPPLALPG